MDCIRCKGRVESKFACGRDFCPIYVRSEAMFKTAELVQKEEFQGTSPSVFVGHHGYPKVNVGILSPVMRTADAWLYDAPRYWASNSFSIKQVVELRSSLVNSRFKAEIKRPEKNLALAQEIALASNPVDVDVKLHCKPESRLVFSGVNLPMGPSAPLRKIELTSNPKIGVKTEKVFSDTDLKSVAAIKMLYSSGMEENSISKILSVGAIGVKRSRKLVPTRWSITATDDQIAKMLLNDVRSYSHADYQLFHGNLYGNYYFVMFFPDAWSYELFEGYLPRSLWNSSSSVAFTSDHEGYYGRKTYAENTAGGYYAARLPIVEKLGSMRKQASVLVVRFITDEYSCHLGVFVCRETVRKAMQNVPIKFSSRDEMLTYARDLISKMFSYDIGLVLSQSVLLRDMNSQTKLSAFSPEPYPY